jgi:kinetochore protein Spc25
MQATMHTLTGSLQERAAASARLRTHIATTQRQIDAKRAAQRAYADRVDAQSRLNAPELAFWERYLGCRIEGSGREDVVKVVFVFEPAKGAAAGGAGGYQVVFSAPRLDDKRLGACVSALDQSRDLAAFLKQMRALFAAMLE